MRVSRFFISTLKEAPSDAEVVSHRLMLRAGLIKRLTSGVYTWMPLGLRVLRRVEAVIREEMNASGAIELLMPAVQPAELWQESQRWDQYGPELLRIKDRHQRDFCFGPTHEEVVSDVVRRDVTLPATVDRSIGLTISREGPFRLRLSMNVAAETLPVAAATSLSSLSRAARSPNSMPREFCRVGANRSCGKGSLGCRAVAGEPIISAGRRSSFSTGTAGSAATATIRSR